MQALNREYTRKHGYFYASMYLLYMMKAQKHYFSVYFPPPPPPPAHPSPTPKAIDLCIPQSNTSTSCYEYGTHHTLSHTLTHFRQHCVDEVLVLADGGEAAHVLEQHQTNVELPGFEEVQQKGNHVGTERGRGKEGGREGEEGGREKGREVEKKGGGWREKGRGGGREEGRGRGREKGRGRGREDGRGRERKRGGWREEGREEMSLLFKESGHSVSSLYSRTTPLVAQISKRAIPSSSISRLFLPAF